MALPAIGSEERPRSRQAIGIAGWAPLLTLVGLAAVVYASGAWRHLTLASLQVHRAALQSFVDAHIGLALASFMAIYALLVLLSVPGATVMTLAGGLLFGPWVGASATLVAATTGATGIYLIARSSLGAALARRAERKAGSLKSLAAGFQRDAFFYLLSLRLMPIVPFWVVNIAAGAGRASLRAFIGASLIGMAPASLIYSFIGSDLGRTFAAGRAPTLASLLDPRLLLPLAGLAVLALTPVILRRTIPYFRDRPHA